MDLVVDSGALVQVERPTSRYHSFHLLLWSCYFLNFNSVFGEYWDTIIIAELTIEIDDPVFSSSNMHVYWAWFESSLERGACACSYGFIIPPLATVIGGLPVGCISFTCLQASLSRWGLDTVVSPKSEYEFYVGVTCLGGTTAEMYWKVFFSLLLMSSSVVPHRQVQLRSIPPLQLRKFTPTWCSLSRVS